MKFPQTHTLKEISQLLECEFVGDDNFPVYGMNEIHVVESERLFLLIILNITTRH